MTRQAAIDSICRFSLECWRRTAFGETPNGWANNMEVCHEDGALRYFTRRYRAPGL
jgi:hypothetical protein